MPILIFLLFVALHSVIIDAHAAERLRPNVTPLPQDQVEFLFKKIEKKEKLAQDILIQALNGPQTTLRAYAATLLGDIGDADAIPYLIDALSDDSMHVGAHYIEAGMATTRYRANGSLKRLTGKDFGFVWNDPVGKRNQAIQKWIRWYQTKNSNSS